MTIDVRREMRFDKALYLGSGKDLNDYKFESGVYDVDTPVNGPASVSGFLEVVRNSGFSSTDQTVVQRFTVKSTGAQHIRVYDETGGWSAWGALPTPAVTVASATVASPTDTELDVADGYNHQVTSGGSGAAENASLADGTVVGQRIYVELAVRTDGSDTVVLDATNIQQLGMSGETPVALDDLTFDAAGEFALLEWDGDSMWNVLYTTATVGTT